MASKYPQISWLFLFLYDLSEKQKIFWEFHSDFGCLTYIFNPVPNRVKIFSNISFRLIQHLTLYCLPSLKKSVIYLISSLSWDIFIKDSAEETNKKREMC